MDKITIQELCEIIGKDILSMTSVKQFYIGKTNNIESAKTRHKDYDKTEAIAVSDAENISKAEIFAIDSFREDSRMDNERRGGAGSEKSDTLYISLKFNITHDYEIDDNAINIECYELLPIK